MGMGTNLTTAIASQHIQRFEEIKRTLTIIGCRESAFVKVELLFFEALSISRLYGEDPAENRLLATLKEIQSEEYQKTMEATKRINQREMNIKKFVVKLKKALTV